MSTSVRDSLLKEAQLLPASGHVNLTVLDESGRAIQPIDAPSGQTIHSPAAAIYENDPHGGTGGSSSANGLHVDANVPLVYLPRIGLSSHAGVSEDGSSAFPVQASVLHGSIDDAYTGGGGNPFTTGANSQADTDKLWSVLANYLSLGQLELARTVMDQLFMAAPEKLIRALRDMVFTNIPSSWLFSRAVPSAGHLSWLAYIEYKKLYARVFPDGAPTVEAREEELLKAHLNETPKPTLMSGTPTRIISRAHLPALSNTPINPYGFITHDRLTLTLIETDGCKLPKDCTSFHARVKLHDQHLQSRVVPAGGVSTSNRAQAINSNTQFKHTFQTTVYYADSNLWVKVYACTPVTGSPNTVRNEICVGEVSLPLHQIRSKNKFHIWLPLHAPSNTNPALLQGASGGSSGGVHSYGRARLKLVWWKSGLVPAGDFSLKTRWLLETDLLMANAVINHRLAPGRKLLTPEIVEEMRAYARATWTAQVARQRAELIQQQERLTKAASAAATGTAATLSGLFQKSMSGTGEVSGETLDGPTSGTLPQDFSTATWTGDTNDRSSLHPSDIDAPQLSDDVFRHLFRLIRSVPTVGHTLAAQLCLISSPDSDQQMFQHMYAQMIGEMVVRREYARACEALVHVCKDIFSCVSFTNAPTPNLSGADVDVESTSQTHSDRPISPSLAMLDAIFLLFVVYIHQGSGTTLDRMAQNLMSNRIAGLDASTMDMTDEKEGTGATASSSSQSSSNSRLGPALTAPGPSLPIIVSANGEEGRSAGSLEGKELQNMSEEVAQQTFSQILDRKTKVYSALLASSSNSSMNMAQLVPGTLNTNLNAAGVGGARADSEQILRRFCLVEDYYLRALVDKLGKFPSFFEELLGNPIDPNAPDHYEEQKRILAEDSEAGEKARAALHAAPPPPPAGKGQQAEKGPSKPKYDPTAQELLDEFLILDFDDDPTYLHAFWRYYSNFIRIQKEHLFEFPIQVALACIRLNQWNKVNLVLKPFNKLRPLVILLAWDSYESQYQKRRELIIRIWRSQRLHAAKELRMRRKHERAIREGAAGVKSTDAFKQVAEDGDDEKDAKEDDLDELDHLSDDELDEDMDEEELEAHQCSEPKLINWCDRLDVFVLWIDTLLNIHPVLSSLTKEAQEAQANQLLYNLKQHSILYSFHTFLPSLAQPEQLLQLINPHESEELKHDYHIMRAFYAIRVVMEIMKQDAARTTELRRDNALLLPEQDEQSFRTVFQTNLDSLKLHIFSMTQAHFQVLTLEKIFSLLFINQKSWLRYERNLATNLEKILGANPEGETGEAEPEEEDDVPDEPDEQHGEQPKAYFHLKGAIISQILDFLKVTITELMHSLELQEEQARKESDELKFEKTSNEKLMDELHLYPASSILNRLNFLKSKVIEGLWRLGVTKEGMKINEPSLNHLVSSLSSMSVFFLKHDQSEEAHLKPVFSSMDYCSAITQPFLRQHAAAARIVADTVKWNELCVKVQDMDLKGARKDIYPFILKYIENYHLEPNQATPPPIEKLKHHQHLQSYFLYMDSSLTFAHLLSELEYVTLIQKALTHTKTVMKSVSESESKEAASRSNEVSYIQDHAKKSNNMLISVSGNADDLVDEEEEESISLELLSFYTAYAEKCILASNTLLKSKLHEVHHPYSLDDANMCDGSGVNGVADSMADEYRPFGFESSANSTYTKWMRIHGAADGLNKGDPSQVTPYLQRYFEYLASVQPVVASQKMLLNPWIGSTGVKVIEYLALQTAHTRENTVPGMASIPHPPISTFVDSFTNKNSENFNSFAYLALQILPALTAVRYVLRSSNNLIGGAKELPAVTEKKEDGTVATTEQTFLDDYQTICLLARQHSQFNPAFHRWINWRLSLYEHLYQFTQHATTIPFVFLSHPSATSKSPSVHSVEQMLFYAKDSFASENVLADQNIIMTLCEIYVDTFESLDSILKKDGTTERKTVEKDIQPDAYRQFIFRTKLSILDMCDQHLDHPANAYCVNLIDRLLASIITDSSCPHTLRSNLILRVNDIICSSMWSLKYLQHWSDVNTCTDVLLKCLAGLSTLEITDQIGVGRKSGKKSELEFDHRHRFDEFESDEDEEGEDGVEGEEEEVDAGVSGRGGSASSEHHAHKKLTPNLTRGASAAATVPSKELFTGSISELRSSIEFKYHIILIYKQLIEMHDTSSAKPDSTAKSPAEAKESKEQEAATASTSGAASSSSSSNPPAPATKQPLFLTWQDMETACNSNLTKVIIQLIQNKLVDIAQKLYVLYKTYSKLYPTPSATMSDPPTQEELELEAHHKLQELLIDEHLTNQLESASLASLLSSSSPTSDRIFAIKRLQSLPKNRIYNVGEGVLSYLDSSHSRYVIAQLLAQFLAGEHRELLEQQATAGKSSIPDQTGSSIAGGDSTSSVQDSSAAGSTPLVRKRFYSSLSPEKERWFIQVHHATKILVCLPEDLQVKYSDLYSDPLAIVTELLKNGQHLFIKKIFPVFKEYCTLTSSADDAFFFVLNFASRLLTLGIEELALDKEVGFMVLELCCSYGEYLKVAKMCLIMCEVLSSKLIHHPHPYLLLHLITAILIFLGRNVLYTGCDIQNPLHLPLFKTYEQYIRLCCGRQVDTRHPIYAAAFAVGAKLKTDATSPTPPTGEGSSSSMVASEKKPPTKIFTDVESKLAEETKQAEETLPLLYALVTTPLTPALSSNIPLSSLPTQSALLSRLLGASFSLKDLERPEKAALVRDQLLNCEHKFLAKRVWKECEHRPGAEFEPYVRARVRQMQRG